VFLSCLRRPRSTPARRSVARLHLGFPVLRARLGCGVFGGAGFGLLRAPLQDLVGRLAVHQGLVATEDRAALDHGAALLARQRAHTAPWRRHQGALDRTGDAFFLQRRDQGLAHAHLGNGPLDVQARIGAEGLRGGAHRFLVTRSEGAQAVLHAVAELAEHGFRQVQWVLGDEVDAHALGADQAHHLLDLVDQGLGRVLEQQMRLVEKEHQPRLVEIAHFGQRLEQLGEQEQQEGGVKPRTLEQLIRGQHVDDAAAGKVGAQQVAELQRGLTEELLTAFLLQLQQRALDGGDGGRADQAVLRTDGLGVLGDMPEQGGEVLEVQQRQALLVGVLEGHGQGAGLGIGQAQQARQQQRAHLGNRGADGVAGDAEDIPEHHRLRRRRIAAHPELDGTLRELGILGAGRGHTGEIAFHVRAEHRHA
jgi:hypothetical protein